MDGFVTMDRQRRLDVLVARPWPGLPQAGRLGWQLAEHDLSVTPSSWQDEVAVIHISLSGHGWVEHDGVRRSLAAGSIMLFNSREHRLSFGFDSRRSRSWEFCWADLTGGAARTAVRELAARRGCIMPGGALVAAAIQRHLPTSGPRQAAWPSERAAQVAWEILAALYSEQPADAVSPLAARAMAWMDAHIALPAGVSAAAKALGISREHLTRHFHDDVGLAPGMWLRQRRLERAELLLASGLDVADAAARVGFASRSHFAAAYRRRHGASPRRRRSAKPAP
jgi:AraC-like DNA-binding protein